MMLLFWIVCVLMVTVAAMALILPLSRTKTLSGYTRDQLNKDLYQDRIEELKSDEEQGILSEKQDFIEEMQRGLLDDVVDDKADFNKSNSPLIWGVGVLFLILFSVGVYSSLGAKSKVEAWQNVYGRLSELTELIMNQQSKATEQDIKDYKLALSTKMQREPDNAMGWLLLGRLNVALGDANSALIAMDRAYRLEPGNSAVVTGYAQGLLMSGDPIKVAKSKRILALLIEKKPNDIEVLSTYAFIALENEDYQLAIERWLRMLPLLEGQPDRIEMIEGSINYAKKQLAQQQGAAAGSAPKVTDTSPPAQQLETQPQGAGAELITVTLDANDAAAVSQGYVYLFAQAVEGPKVPLAVVKLNQPQLPLIVSLSDSNSMMPEMTLSQFPVVKISAKFSLDASVTTPDDDFTSNDVIVAEKDPRTIRLIINN